MRLLIVARNRAVGVEDGCVAAAEGTFDITLRIPDGELRPGLINAHDHLHRNHYGRLGKPPYANAYEWGRDIHARHGEVIARGRSVARRAALLGGAWKNLLSGVTTVVHHDPWEADFEREFPVKVARIRCAHSFGFDPVIYGTQGPLALHVAEGVDGASADEVRELEKRRWLGPALLAVHVVGADADGIRRLRRSGAAIVWCPTSNLFLFGRTAPAALLEPGVDVLLGSDSLLTADGTLLDELRVARRLGWVSDDRLLDAVGRIAAHRLGLPPPSLEPGAPADLVVMRKPPFEAGDNDVALVMVSGEVRVLDPVLLPALGDVAADGRMQRSGGVVRWVCDPRAYQPSSMAASAPSSNR